MMWLASSRVMLSTGLMLRDGSRRAESVRDVHRRTYPRLVMRLVRPPQPVEVRVDDTWHHGQLEACGVVM
jgi:hypothetical protein